jgi:uncharacterized short protein YbdD (DUF466 family)
MSIDKINIFQLGGDVTDDSQDPLYPEYLQLVEQFEALKDMPAIPGGYPDAPSFAKFKQQKAREQAVQTMTGALDEGDVKKAYEEGFTQLPIGEQLLHYINPITGVPIETYETGYFTKKGGLEVKSPQEILMDVVNPNKNIAQKTFLKADDPLSAAIAPLSALGALGGIFELANIPKAALIGISRRMNQRAMDGGGGGGGISDLPKPKQETTKDLAGYKSNVYEEAVAVSNELKPEALLKYLKSNKRTNPENNKLRIGLKQTEIDEIDFDAFEAQYPNKDFTNEELLQYINDNRIQLYRVPRSENPTYGGGIDDSSVEFYADEPMISEYRAVSQNNYDRQYRDFVERQIDFFDKHFPEGVINKQNYIAFKQRQEEFIVREDLDIDTSGQAPSQLVNEFLVQSEFNPYLELGQDQFEFISPDGTLKYLSIDDLPSETELALRGLSQDEGVEYLLEQGYSLKPKILDEDLQDFNNITEQAAEQRVDRDYEDGYGTEVYRYEGPNDVYEIIGSDVEGYNVKVNGSYDDAIDEFISLDEARIQIEQREIAEGNISVLGNFDDYSSEDDLIDILPRDVIEGGATVPNRYERMDDFRLPMGGADDYEEYTIHIKNPKTTTRYSSQKGNKHYGGGDELFHIRTTIRTDENGKKVLFVEEIQSDLHSTARSTQTAATYELPPKEKQKINEQLNNIFQDLGITGERTNTGDFVFKNKQGENQSLDADSLPFIARDIRAGRTENFGSKNANDFVDTFGLEKTQEIGDMLAKVRPSEGAFFMDGKLPNLPDFPYKKDWVDLAVKEAMKIGAEKNVDRVAFTNAATQIDRNNKRLNYVQDKVITEVPTEKEILASDEYATALSRNIDIRYQDYVNDVRDVSNPNAGELPMSKEEFVLTGPIDPRRYANVQEELQDLTLETLKNIYGTGRYKYKLEDVGYRLEGDEILNPQRTQLVGDDYDTQRINTRMLTNDEELLAELPENLREQVKKDLAAGKKEITLNINNTEGSGKKFEEIYANEIPRGINKVLKELKVKDTKPNISNVLFTEAELIEPEDILEEYQLFIRDLSSGAAPIQTHSSIGIDLTDDMKRKIIQDGLNNMYMGGKVSKSNSMDRPIAGNVREM